MLRRLAIHDFALIDRVALEFEPGLNLFTGETGAGKSIILDALSLILGERASAGLIRGDCEQAYVEALFDAGTLPRVEGCLADHGLASDPDGLLIAREVTRAGKNRCFVNGRQTVLACLKELGDLLVDIHGQHEHQRLLSTANHMEILDAFGDAEYQTFRSRCLDRIVALRATLARLQDQERLERDRQVELDALDYQASELDAAALREGEDDELEREWRLLSRAEEVRRELGAMTDGLAGEEGPQMLRSLAVFRQSLDEVAAADPAMAPAARNLTDAYYLLEDANASVQNYLSGFGPSPERLAEIEERLTVINKLKRKYGHTTVEMLERRSRIESRLAELRGQAESRGQLLEAATSLKRELVKDLPELSRRRKRLAELLERRVTGELADLAMKGSVFQVKLEREPQAAPGDMTLEGQGWRLFRDGLERAEFFVSTNPGEPLLPLVKVASGGELSRVTLALKSSLAVLEAVPIMVFDEIDAGIGGETAANVARKLLQVSRRCQCLCITHLPQIAACGQVHFAVRKKPRKDRTVVSVERLQGEAREAEVARMLGGKSGVSLELARELMGAGTASGG